MQHFALILQDEARGDLGRAKVRLVSDRRVERDRNQWEERMAQDEGEGRAKGSKQWVKSESLKEEREQREE